MVDLVRDGRKIATQSPAPSLALSSPDPLPSQDFSSPKLEEHLLFERFMCWWNQLRRGGHPPVEPERHFTFFKLWDAFEQEECPICYLSRKARDLFLSNLWYENVNDVGLRNHLHRSLGFCPDAGHRSISMGDDLGASIIYRSLCDDVADRLAKHDAIVPTQHCPVADHVATMNRNYVQAFAAHYVAKDVQERHEKSFGLCVQHIQETLAVLSDPDLRKTFSGIEEVKFRGLAKELNTLIGKSDYQNKQPLGPERDAWIRAILKFNRNEQPNL
jgi:hypothetical protein